MNNTIDHKYLNALASDMEGELYFDDLHRKIYSTDASAYRDIPEAVAIPKTRDDIKKLVLFAQKHSSSLIPRTAGTSLAGQVVGKGIIVDVSKYFNNISEPDSVRKTVWVEPGVIRDELNLFLDKYDLYFGPETSTANRAMIGGMVGNNSCGSNSVIYGSTREHLKSLKAILSNGTEVEFGPISKSEFDFKKSSENPNELEREIYRHIFETLSIPENKSRIEMEFPKKEINRRNTGYAIDILMQNEVFSESGELFNMCKLIAGSEGTLAFITDIELALVDKEPDNKILLCAHFNTIYDSLKANLIALKYNPSASELMDHYVLECTKENIEYKQYRFFVKGDPKAILVVEFNGINPDEVKKRAENCIEELEKEDLGYHFPIIQGEDLKKVWKLRKAGLGLLSNIPGDAKPAPVIEDTAVSVEDLPDYIMEFNKILDRYNLYCVHYAHAGSGELHLRPILNLKTKGDRKLFRTILEEISTLVKKYNGSLSGEHGDGRLRAEFIRKMIGDENYHLLKDIKKSFDPQNIFNPGKIVDTPPMDTHLRYEEEQKEPDIETLMDFSEHKGYMRSAEMCNGSGDCRKTHLSGGTMCPSYMATKNEGDTTRARANTLREYLSRTEKNEIFDQKEIKEVLDLCLSCKGCKSECPSNVDMAKLKAEFTYQYNKINGTPFRDRLFSNFDKANSIASKVPGVYNFLTQNKFISPLVKSGMGINSKRSLPRLEKQTLLKWFEKNRTNINPLKPRKRVYLFADEFCNYNDVSLGITTIKFLIKMGYEVIIPTHKESGRSSISKGILEKSKHLAEENVSSLSKIVNKDNPLIGIEPSAILGFKDEYPSLVSKDLKHKAQNLAKNTFLIEDFIYSEFKNGNINPHHFTDEKKEIIYHGHCHQKAICGTNSVKEILSIPVNYKFKEIPSGCCGMAGSFGYEKEHYDLSMKIAELVLLPRIRNTDKETIIAASGTSCRHQIKDGTGRIVLHPVEILYNALQ